jgi:hypothetical protein
LVAFHQFRKSFSFLGEQIVRGAKLAAHEDGVRQQGVQPVRVSEYGGVRQHQVCDEAGGDLAHALLGRRGVCTSYE